MDERKQQELVPAKKIKEQEQLQESSIRKGPLWFALDEGNKSLKMIGSVVVFVVETEL